MTSIRLRGLTSVAQFDCVLQHVRSNSRSDVVFTSAVAAVDQPQHGFEATVTFKNVASQTRAFGVLGRLMSGIIQAPELNLHQLQVDADFLGMTVLASPSAEDADLSVE